MRTTILTLVFLTAGCSAPTVIMELSEPDRPVIPGVDSIRIQTAWQLAEESFAKDIEKAARLAEEGRELADLADSFMESPTASMERDTIRAIEAFNTGAELLEQFTETDSLQSLELLKAAAEKFEEALEADAFDDEARQWLAKVYKMLAERFHQSGAIQNRLRVLERLVMWNQNRHDFIALLAAAQEDLQSETYGMTAGALWERAALIALDDVDMGFRSAPDSAALFAYHVRASRAFIQADRVSLARESLNRARTWQRTESEYALIHADSVWLAWDDGNLAARKRFDALLNEAPMNPQKVVDGLLILLEEVRSEEARTDVRYQLALAKYGSGFEGEAIELMKDLVTEDPQRRAIVDDYAIMAYNFAQQQREAGNLKDALAYLLQCASLDADIIARCAFDAALLLRNNPDAAIRYAHMAESRIEALNGNERSALIKYLAELYRRNGDRERAREYIMYLDSSTKN
ncbi:MAG: hypothetical protein OXE92_05310 [Bacteroidetes bacterium]|nr:hypothetical protein [Bacteroidota bacterium]